MSRDPHDPAVTRRRPPLYAAVDSTIETRPVLSNELAVHHLDTTLF
jgi:hypothetical protein